MGAWMAGLVPINFLNKEHSFQLPERLRHLPVVTLFLMGVTFSDAWTPCVGTVLGSIGKFLLSMGPFFIKIQKAGGFLLVILGILLLTNKFAVLTSYLFQVFYSFGFQPLL
jgi:cytochrome c-type biogenesis protein